MTIARAARIVLCACVAAAAAWAASACAETVRVEVDGRTVVSRDVPRVFGFGGNVWRLTDVFNAGITERILGMQWPGTTRVSLGDSILEPAANPRDLRARLAAFPLNDFLRRYKAAGGRVLFILDGTPQWLSSSSDGGRVKGPDQPRFRMSPPSDFDGWSDVVEAVVRHFNGKLGLDAFYEAWNEPNYYYYGTADQFMNQYYHSVVGARRADPRARIGGPGISEFIGAGTALAPATEADKVRIATFALEQRFLFRQFLEQAAKTPVPELGLARLPVDFFSWHGFYFDPARYYSVVVPYVRDALAQAGYPRSTPMVNTEWNIAPVPPYPEGDLNATHVGAAYAAASLIAMNEAGVDAQSFQMYLDPGGQGYYGGVFTASGIPRANFHALSLFSRLRGRQVRATSSDPWVKATAFVDGDTAYVLVASYVPTKKMITQTQQLSDYLENADFERTIVDAKLVDTMVGGRALPDAQARKAREIEDTTRQRIQAALDQASRRGDSVTIEIAASGLAAAPRQVTRFLIDSKHANIFPDMAAATRLLESKRKPAGGEAAYFQRALEAAGIKADAARELVRVLTSGDTIDRGLSRLPVSQREPALRALEGARADLIKMHRDALAEVEKMPSAHLDSTRLDWPGTGPLRVTVEANSVQLLVLTP